MIGEAFFKVGLDGVVKVEESRRRKTTLELREGIVLERGCIAEFMAVDNDRTSVELDDPYILLCDTKFTDPQDILPFLILCAEDDRDALAISEGTEGQALGLIAQNQKNRTVITDLHGDPGIVSAKISETRHLIESCDYDFNRDRYKERLAAFVSGIAVITVGADTEPELWERKRRASWIKSRSSEGLSKDIRSRFRRRGWKMSSTTSGRR